jgi:hypothetical protein
MKYAALGLVLCLAAVAHAPQACTADMLASRRQLATQTDSAGQDPGVLPAPSGALNGTNSSSYNATIVNCDDTPSSASGWLALPPWGRPLVIVVASLVGLIVTIALSLWCCGCCLMAGAEAPMEAAMAARKSHLGARASWGGYFAERISHAGGAPAAGATLPAAAVASPEMLDGRPASAPPGTSPAASAKGAGKGGAAAAEAQLQVKEGWIASALQAGESDEEAGQQAA